MLYKFETYETIHISNGIIGYEFLDLHQFFDVNDNNYFYLPITLNILLELHLVNNFFIFTLEKYPRVAAEPSIHLQHLS
jgi:hypothetical protein